MNQVNDATILRPEFEHADGSVSNSSDRQAPTEREFRAVLNQKLRIPLNTIIGFAELVAMRPGTAATDPDIQHIVQAARDLLDIINRELADPKVLPKNTPSPALAISCDVLYIEDDLVNFTLVARI